ncbi:uncharacterized protein LOC132913345 isoform X2 [Bombus pascuorum]|uniref:uncharacterized protein LOC132913345 isoform X2 n=1 Tax=Bombus pascuorum TaxID=65598 RepID=UPI00298D7DC1|nr:uncharacterized protein LOC132913345 isoform X2 [Bombus pascuorum]
MPKIRAKRSAIWLHFSIVYQNDGLNAIVRCNKCNLIVPYCKNTTNLWSHVRTHHKDVLEINSSSCKKEAGQSNTTASSSSETKYKAVITSEISDVLRRSSSNFTEAGEITRSLVQMIAQDVLPFSIINGKGFINFVRTLNEKYKIPKRSILISKYLPDSYARKCMEIKESLSKATCVNVAISSQENTKRSGLILATSVHFCVDRVQYHKLLRISFQSMDDKFPILRELDEIEKDALSKWEATFETSPKIHERPNRDVPSVSEVEWNIISEIIKVLGPLHEATKELFSDLHVTISKIIPIVHGIEAALKDMDDLSADGTLFRDNLLRCFCARFKDVEESVGYAIATFLDPRYKDVAFHSKKCIENVKNILTKSNVSDDENTNSDESTINSSQTNDENTETNILWAAFDKRVEELGVKPDNCGINCPSRHELERYINLKIINRKDDPIAWWSTTGHVMFPNLSKIAADYLCAPAYSVSNNPLFSKLQKMLFDRRVRLSDERTNMLAVIGLN